MVWLPTRDAEGQTKTIKGPVLAFIPITRSGDLVPELKDIIKAVKVVVDRKTLLITGMEAVDVNGNSAEYSFSKIKVNPGLKAARFNFIMPKNVEIIDNQ